MGKKDGQYGVDAVISIDVSVSLILNAQDEDEAHDKSIKICEEVASSISSRIQYSLRITKQENEELDDIVETDYQDTLIEKIKEIEAPTYDEEEEG